MSSLKFITFFVFFSAHLKKHQDDKINIQGIEQKATTGRVNEKKKRKSLIRAKETERSA
jgi:hypothetical protein